jgi:hypothetical protein
MLLRNAQQYAARWCSGVSLTVVTPQNTDRATSMHALNHLLYGNIDFLKNEEYRAFQFRFLCIYCWQVPG